MADTRTKKRAEMREQTLALLSDPSVVTLIQEADPSDAAIADLLQQAALINPAIMTIESLVNVGLNISGTNIPLKTALQTLLSKEKLRKNAESELSGMASHREKRALITSLGLRKKPISIADSLDLALAGTDTSISDIRIIWRERDTSSSIRAKTVLADTKCRDKGDAVVDAEAGFYVLQRTESAIFVSLNKDTGKIQVELVVLRGLMLSSQYSAEFYAWASEVVMYACNERRNVRPTHDGTMVQLGWNAGPRHASHDEDIIALLTIFWSLAKASLPLEIMEPLETCLATTGMPRLATRQVSEGEGYQLVMNGKTYVFPMFERAPPEGYMSQDYSAPAHKDQSYAPYALSWCVDRTVDDITTLAASVGEDKTLWPQGGGGSFVDITLRVVVPAAAGTLMAFQPKYLHGTTRHCGGHNRMCTITFSNHILKAYEVAKEGVKVESGAGAGNNDEIRSELN